MFTVFKTNALVKLRFEIFESLFLNVQMSSSSSDLLTSVTKAGGSATSSQLGFSQLAYSSSSCDGVSASGGGGGSAKLLPSNGPNHYVASYSYHSGPSSLVTMSSDYNLTQEQLQYTFGDSQRYRANGPPVQQNFSSAVFPPGYNSGPLPNQLHYSNAQGPAKLFASEKPSANAYSMGPDVAGLYADKQGVALSTSLAPQSFDSTSVYQSAGVFHGGGGQPSGISLSYPGISSGLTFQGMQVESSGFDAEQYPTYRQKDGPTGYDIAGAANGQKGAVNSAVQGQISQSFSSNFGSGSNAATQSNGGSPFTGQSQSAPPMGAQGQGASSGGPLGNQRQGASAGPGFANHASSSSQPFVGQVEASSSATALSSGVALSATAGGKLSDSVSKLNLKDGKPGDVGGQMTTSADGAGKSAVGVMASLGSAVASTVTGIMTSKTSLSAAAKSSLSQSKI